MTQAGHDYKNEAWKYIMPFFNRKPFETPVAVTFRIYRPRANGDIDAVNKLCLDVQEGIVFTNDELVMEQHNYKHYNKDNPRVEVEVWEL